MLAKLLSLAATLVAITALAAPATAQVGKIANSGCPGAPYPTTVGAPAIGKVFGVVAAPCRTAAGMPFIVIGTPGPNIVLPMPLACMRGCVLACRPSIILYGAAFRAQIPNNRALIGSAVCIQSGCIEAVRPKCILLHGALGVRITP